MTEPQDVLAEARHGVITYDDHDEWLIEDGSEGTAQIVARQVPRWFGRLVVAALVRTPETLDVPGLLSVAASPAPDPGAGLVERIDDELGHRLDAWLAPGSVDSRGHNTTPDGEPHGDCYKCRRIRDFIREYVAAPSAEPPETA